MKYIKPPSRKWGDEKSSGDGWVVIVAEQCEYT